MYEMDSEEAAEWLKSSNVMKAFIAKMGSTADYREGFTLPHASWWTPCTLLGVYKESTGTLVGLHRESMDTLYREDSDSHSL